MKNFDKEQFIEAYESLIDKINDVLDLPHAPYREPGFEGIELSGETVIFKTAYTYGGGCGNYQSKEIEFDLDELIEPISYWENKYKTAHNKAMADIEKKRKDQQEQLLKKEKQEFNRLKKKFGK